MFVYSISLLLYTSGELGLSREQESIDKSTVAAQHSDYVVCGWPDLGHELCCRLFRPARYAGLGGLAIATDPDIRLAFSSGERKIGRLGRLYSLVGKHLRDGR